MSTTMNKGSDRDRKPRDLPNRLGRFVVRGLLGSGGMGVVLDAMASSNQRVALKLAIRSDDVERRLMNSKRLSREAEILGRLNHPGVVRLYESGDLDGLDYLALEYVDGVSLDTIRRRTALSRKSVIALAQQLLATLAHIHEMGVVHCDIKPGNVVVSRDGRVVLMDFGAAHLRGMQNLTPEGEVVGSIGYLARELIAGGSHSPASDQYALGRLLFEIAAVRPSDPLPEGLAPSDKLLHGLRIDWSRFPGSGRWRRLEAIIRRMVSDVPARRYQDARACLAAIIALDSPVYDSSDEDTDDLQRTADVIESSLELHDAVPTPRDPNITTPYPLEDATTHADPNTAEVVEEIEFDDLFEAIEEELDEPEVVEEETFAEADYWPEQLDGPQAEAYLSETLGTEDLEKGIFVPPRSSSKAAICCFVAVFIALAAVFGCWP